MSELEGKVAIITGGARGAGLGIAKAYVKEGVAVTITDIVEPALKDAEAELEALVPGARVLTILADNKDHEAAQRVVAETVAAFGRLDILVNNAQEFRTGIAVEDITWDDMITSYESGVFGYLRFMVAAFPHLKETGGTVINFGSGAGTRAVPKNGAYGSNKEAVRGLSRIAAREWGQFDITVNVVNPLVNSAESERFKREFPDVLAEVMRNVPLGRYGDAELEIGGVCVFLAKPEGKYITGSTLQPNGGADIRP